MLRTRDPRCSHGLLIVAGQKRLLLGGGAIPALLSLLLAGCTGHDGRPNGCGAGDERTASAPVAPATISSPEDGPGPKMGCEGWMAEVCRTVSSLGPYSTQAWVALLHGEPLDALDGFAALPAPSSTVDAIGLRRAWLETGRVLVHARAAGLRAQAVYLDKKLELAPERPEYRLFRAAVALQQGDDEVAARHLEPLAGQPGWARAAEALMEIRKAPLSEEARELSAARRWRNRLSDYVRALESVEVGHSGRGIDRHRMLLSWTEGAGPPPPAEWGPLELHEPDYLLGACSGGDEDCIGTFDPSLYSILSVLALERAAEVTAEVGDAARFVALQALRVLDPAMARAEACRWLEDHDGTGRVFGEEMALSPALIYSQWGDGSEVEAQLDRWCRAEALSVSCPAHGGEARDELNGWVEAVRRCVAERVVEGAAAGRVARTVGVYEVVARRRFLAPYLEGQCAAASTLEGLGMWSASMIRSRAWRSLEGRAAWLGAGVEARQYYQVRQTRFALSQAYPVLFPLGELVSRAQLAELPEREGGQAM